MDVVVVHIFLSTSIYLPAVGEDADVSVVLTVIDMSRQSD
jgi:hypothetical protein